MDINKDEYRLNESSYIPEEYDKDKIVVGGTLTTDMNHFKAWRNKINGKYKKTAAYTILLNGKIYEHFNPKYYSHFLGSKDLNKQVIPIVLENQGWVAKDFTSGSYFNWSGEVYKGESKLYQKSWRGKNRWTPYSKTQINALAQLCNILINEFDIERNVSPNNIKIGEFSEKKGIYYRANFSKTATDISPAFNIEEFSKKIENYGKHI